jgi:hypothetical protein
MDQLDQALSALRREYEPDAEARGRVRMLVLAQAGVLGAASAGATGLGPTAGGAKTALGWKLAGGSFSALKGTALAVLVGGGVLVSSTEQPKNVSRAVEVPLAEPSGSVVPSPRAEAPSVRTSADIEPAVSLPVLNPPSEALKSSKSVEAKKRGATVDELRLLTEASQAFRSGNLDLAERTLARHRKTYPESTLLRERQGLLLSIRCARGVTPEVRELAEHFVRHDKASPIDESVKNKCLR